LLAGAPLSYWAGKEGQNPMRYDGGIYGGSWLALMLADLGNGKFGGAYLVENFENLNPDNSYWTKYYSLYSKIDTEAPRFLEFERWWNGYFFMNKDEFETIVDDLFIGNKLSKGELTTRDGSVRIDLRNIKSPIVIFCSWGDNITPPQQALNWILDLYASVDEIKVNEQTIVYNVHQNIGHLGIFVSAKIAQKEYSEIFENLELIELLPPGLYEMQIIPRDPNSPGSEFVSGAYETLFHERSLDDIRAFDDGRADEQPFEVVERVSQINGALYERFLAPAIRGSTTEASAQTLRALQPSRMMRLMWSDKRNPFMTPSRAGRKPFARTGGPSRRTTRSSRTNAASPRSSSSNGTRIATCATAGRNSCSRASTSSRGCAPRSACRRRIPPPRNVRGNLASARTGARCTS
jgi:hypothetical protein